MDMITNKMNGYFIFMGVFDVKIFVSINIFSTQSLTIYFFFNIPGLYRWVKKMSTMKKVLEMNHNEKLIKNS